MTRTSLAETAHRIIRGYLHDGAVAIDATVGNGHDTVYLAECVGDRGRVFGFDVQLQALDATRKRLLQHGLGERVSLIHASHADMALHIPAALSGQVQAIMFNLGYLPGADKSVITQVESTLMAVGAACRLLADNGVLTVLAYPGHVGGDEEARHLARWCRGLDQSRFQTELVFSSHPKPTAPRLFVVRKRV